MPLILIEILNKNKIILIAIQKKSPAISAGLLHFIF